MYHCLGREYMWPVYPLPSPGVRPSERGPSASPRTQSILIADKRNRKFDLIVYRNHTTRDIRTFFFGLLQHHGQIQISKPLWLPKERVQIEPVTLPGV